MADAQCAGCGMTFQRRTGSHKFCTPACRERFKALDPSRRQRYSTAHQKLRAQIAVEVEAGRAVCARCSRPIDPLTPEWDLDHVDGGNGYLGASHARCNRSTMTRRGGDDIRMWTRRWFEDAAEGTVLLGVEVRRRGEWVPLEPGGEGEDPRIR